MTAVVCGDESIISMAVGMVVVTDGGVFPAQSRVFRTHLRPQAMCVPGFALYPVALPLSTIQIGDT